MYKLFKETFVRTNEHSVTDRMMVKQCLESYSIFNLNPNSIVLDLGANIGGFAIMCKNAGVENYTAVEADNDNCDVILENIKEKKSYILIRGACSVLDDDTLTFYRRNSKQSACSGSINPKSIKNLEPFLVKNYHIDNLIEKIKPDCLKMDIEGTEKNILAHWNNTVPSCVNEFALEIHNGKYTNFFEKEIQPKLLEDFDLIKASPVHGFINRGKDWKHFDHEYNSVLFGFDLFYRRKNESSSSIAV